MLNIFRKDLSDDEFQYFYNHSKEIFIVITELAHADSLVNLKPKLDTVFDTKKNRNELIKAMNYLPKAVINFQNKDYNAKIKLLVSWHDANVENDDYESIFDVSAIAVSTLMILYAVQIEWIDSIKDEYKNKYNKLWNIFENIAELLALRFEDYFSSDMNTLKQFAPLFYKKYILKKMIDRLYSKQ